MASLITSAPDTPRLMGIGKVPQEQLLETPRHALPQGLRRQVETHVNATDDARQAQEGQDQ